MNFLKFSRLLHQYSEKKVPKGPEKRCLTILNAIVSDMLTPLNSISVNDAIFSKNPFFVLDLYFLFW
jgi:hypothetical protein